VESKGNATSENRNVSRAAGIIGFYTFLSRILGLVRDVVLARYFGSGMAADAFFVALRIPNLLRRLFAEGSLTIAFIPVFTEYLRQKTKVEAFQLAAVVLTLLTLALSLLALTGILFSPWIVRIQAFGFGSSGIKYELTVLLTRITFPYVFLIGLTALCMGILNSLRHFAAPAAAPIFLNVGIIGATLWIAPRLEEPIVGVAIGVLIGGILQVGLQVPWILKEGLPLAPTWMPDHPAVKRIGVLMVPALFGSAIYQFNHFIGTLLASFLPEGSISWLYYADRLVQFPLGVFAIAVSTAALPSFSRQVAAQDLQELVKTLGHALRFVFFIAIPSTVGLMITGKLIIKVFFERGAFDAHAGAMTFEALLGYSIGLWAFSGIRILASAFYAFQDTRTPVKIATVALAANVLFSLLLMGPLKHGGLALALSLASALQFALLAYALKLRLRTWPLVPILSSALKSFLSSVIMAMCVYALYDTFWIETDSPSGLYSGGVLIALVLSGLLVYLSAARILGCPEVNACLDLAKPLLKKIGSKPNY
jgi:putative peptidoglycan lipid II flippase